MAINFNDIWLKTLGFLRFLARILVAILVILAAVNLVFLIVLFMFRATQWVWNHVLSYPL